MKTISTPDQLFKAFKACVLLGVLVQDFKPSCAWALALRVYERFPEEFPGFAADLVEADTCAACGSLAEILKERAGGADLYEEARRISQAYEPFIKPERRIPARQQALEEMTELHAKLTSAQAAEAELTKFEVMRSRYFLLDGYAEPILELCVANNTPYRVARAHFEVAITSPGRATPWTAGFAHPVLGGLGPGEKAQWHLRLLQIFPAAWGNQKVPTSAECVVEVKAVEGADGQVLVDPRVFTEDDAKRLALLLSEYGLYGPAAAR